MLQDILTQEVASWELLGHPALLQRFVLRNGKAFTPAKRIGRKQAANGCYKNSALHVVTKGGTYVEGYVISKDLPIALHHAWVTYDGKTAMDPTLDAATHEYFGVEFDRRTMSREITKNQVYGLLDLGLGYNTDFMFQHDPELKAICEGVRKSQCTEGSYQCVTGPRATIEEAG